MTNKQNRIQVIMGVFGSSKFAIAAAARQLLAGFWLFGKLTGASKLHLNGDGILLGNLGAYRRDCFYVVLEILYDIIPLPAIAPRPWAPRQGGVNNSSKLRRHD